MNAQGELLKIGDLAKQAGKTVRAIHLYEEMGLLQPVTRSSGGFRLYDASAVERVRWIELLHAMGFSLHDMRDVLRMWWNAEQGPEAMQRLRGLFERKLADTRVALRRHQQLERELLDGLAYLRACGVCETHESTMGCVRCEHDHGMSGEPALLAGITSGTDGRRRPGGRRGDFVPLREVGRARARDPG